jgi:hypothetical protein
MNGKIKGACLYRAARYLVSNVVQARYHLNRAIAVSKALDMLPRAKSKLGFSPVALLAHREISQGIRIVL